MRIVTRFSAILFFVLLLACMLIMHGAIPFVALPTLPHAFWATGFSLSFVNNSLLTLYATNFGLPEPAPITFGLAGAYPIALFIQAGLHPADAYSATAALWLGLAFFGAWRVGLLLGLKSWLSTLAATLWLSMPIIWAHANFSMLSFGIALLPCYFLATFKLLRSCPAANTKLLQPIVAYLSACLISVFMDGYTFMMFAVGASLLLGYSVLRFQEARNYLVKVALPVHILSFALAYLLYAAYIGKPEYGASSLNFFRGWSLDLTFLSIPTYGIHWLWDLLGLSIQRSEDFFFGDGSVWVTTFSLPLIIVGVTSWWIIRKKHPLAHGVLLITIFGYYMAMGPSLKVNSIKPEPMGSSMPAEFAIAPTGNAALSQYLPGFKNMRAAYRWCALGVFGMWLLLMLQLSQGKRTRDDLLGALILITLIVSFLPHLDREWYANTRERESFFEVDRDLVSELALDLHHNEIVAFLPFRNDFLINYLASSLGIRTYNIGGDKNLFEARKHWPDFMQQFKMDKIDPGFAERVLSLLARGEATAVILPYIDMLLAAHAWPAPLEYKDDLIPVLTALENTGYVVLEKRKHYAVARLVPQFQGDLHRGELEREIFFKTCNTPFPVSIQGKTCSLDYVLDSGWYKMENNHVWSKKEAQIRLPIPVQCKFEECAVALTISAYGASKTRTVNVIFQVDAEDIKSPAPLAMCKTEQQQVLIPLSATRPTQTISIKIPEATSPKELQNSPDPRVLGIALFSIELVSMAQNN